MLVNGFRCDRRLFPTPGAQVMNRRVCRVPACDSSSFRPDLRIGANRPRLTRGVAFHYVGTGSSGATAGMIIAS